MEEHVLIGKQCLLVPVCQEGWLCFDWMRLYTCHNHFNAPWLFELSHQTLCLINLPHAITRNSTPSLPKGNHATMHPCSPHHHVRLGHRRPRHACGSFRRHGPHFLCMGLNLNVSLITCALNIKPLMIIRRSVSFRTALRPGTWQGTWLSLSMMVQC